MLQLSGAASGDGGQAPVSVSPAELPAPERESRTWTIAKAALSFGPIIAIAVVGVLAIVSGNTGG